MCSFWNFIKDFLVNSITTQSGTRPEWEPRSLQEYQAINLSLAKLDTYQKDRSNLNLYTPFGDDIYSILPYQNPIAKELIHELKFKNNVKAITIATNILLLGIDELARMESLDHMLVIPALSSVYRRRDKGFDQCLNISRNMMGTKTDDRIQTINLLKRKGSLWGKAQTQHSLTRGGRLQNTRSIFYIDTKLMDGLLDKVSNFNELHKTGIIVFDDVTTTGSTLRACIQTITISLNTPPKPIKPRIFLYGLALAH